MRVTKSDRLLNDWLALLEVRHPKTIDLGLVRCRDVWQRMGAPQPAPRSFVIAGTNGKGSTVANICAALDGLGYRYGSYTTPHVYRYNERIQLQREAVADAVLLDAFERVEAARGDTSLTYFEFGTLAALSILEQAKLDFAVLEIGLGGRLDAVNLVDADCAVITPIGLDHQEYLGNDLLGIGREKAGIIRPGRPVICGEAHPPLSVLEVASALQAPVKRLEVEFEIRAMGDGLRFRAGATTLDLPRPALTGPHQVANLATAVAAVLVLVPAAARNSEALAAGLSTAYLPGRFERLAERPAVWIDVGHNPLGAQAMQGALQEQLSDGAIRRFRCVLAMLIDKDAAGAAIALRDVVAAWYCAPTTGSRGQRAEQLADRISGPVGAAPVRLFGSVSAALDAAVADSAPDDGVLVFGSFATAAEAGLHWRKRAADG